MCVDMVFHMEREKRQQHRKSKRQRERKRKRELAFKDFSLITWRSFYTEV